MDASGGRESALYRPLTRSPFTSETGFRQRERVQEGLFLAVELLGRLAGNLCSSGGFNSDPNLRVELNWHRGMSGAGPAF